MRLGSFSCETDEILISEVMEYNCKINGLSKCYNMSRHDILTPAGNIFISEPSRWLESPFDIHQTHTPFGIRTKKSLKLATRNLAPKEVTTRQQIDFTRAGSVSATAEVILVVA